MSLYLKIQNQISWIVKQIQCIKTGACIVCEHPVTSVNGKLGDVVLDGTEIELIDGGGVSVTQAISDLDSDLNNIVFPVTTVNAKTGDVVLDPDDLDDSETYHKFATADQLDHIQINTEVISNLDDVYLPLTGGTLSGQLNANGGVVTPSVTNNGIKSTRYRYETIGMNWSAYGSSVFDLSNSFGFNGDWKDLSIISVAAFNNSNTISFSANSGSYDCTLTISGGGVGVSGIATTSFNGSPDFTNHKVVIIIEENI